MKREYIFFKHVLLYSILILYIIILAKILLFKYVSPFELFSADRAFSRTLNIIPIQQILEYLFGSTSLKIGLINVVGNVVIFIPMGIYLQLFKKNKRILNSITLIFLISLCVESTQFIFGIGGSDIDDIILNTIGGLIGVFIYKAIALFFKDESRTKNVIITCSCIASALCLVPIIRYYPQMLYIQNRYEVAVEGREFAVDDRNSDILGQFISFSDGVLTVRNGTGINNRKDKYGDVEISVEVDPDIKMAKKSVDYNFSANKILITYSNFTYEEFKDLGNEDSVSFNIVVVNDKWIAKDICVMFAKDVHD